MIIVLKVKTSGTVKGHTASSWDHPTMILKNPEINPLLHRKACEKKEAG
jgi:CobQ-like glutamine amidotransferase family enzyme